MTSWRLFKSNTNPSPGSFWLCFVPPPAVLMAMAVYIHSEVSRLVRVFIVAATALPRLAAAVLLQVSAVSSVQVVHVLVEPVDRLSSCDKVGHVRTSLDLVQASLRAGEQLFSHLLLDSCPVPTANGKTQVTQETTIGLAILLAENRTTIRSTVNVLVC